MRLRHLVAVCLVLFAMSPLAAVAQEREPEASSVALGGDVGFFVADKEFHVGFTPQVFGEFYLLPRLSFRALAGWSRNEYVDELDLFLEQYRWSVNATWNWEAELWHPFITAGAGAHTARLRQDTLDEHTDWKTEPAVNAGVGVEFFARPKVTIKAEGTYYLVKRGRHPAEASGFALSIGLKKYW